MPTALTKTELMERAFSDNSTSWSYEERMLDSRTQDQIIRDYCVQQIKQSYEIVSGNGDANGLNAFSENMGTVSDIRRYDFLTFEDGFTYDEGVGSGWRELSRTSSNNNYLRYLEEKRRIEEKKLSLISQYVSFTLQGSNNKSQNTNIILEYNPNKSYIEESGELVNIWAAAPSKTTNILSDASNYKINIKHLQTKIRLGNNIFYISESIKQKIKEINKKEKTLVLNKNGQFIEIDKSKMALIIIGSLEGLSKFDIKLINKAADMEAERYLKNGYDAVTITDNLSEELFREYLNPKKHPEYKALTFYGHGGAKDNGRLYQSLILKDYGGIAPKTIQKWAATDIFNSPLLTKGYKHLLEVNLNACYSATNEWNKTFGVKVQGWRSKTSAVFIYLDQLIK